MRMIAALLIGMLCFQYAPQAQSHPDKLPSAVRLRLNKRFPGWRFAEVSQEVRQFFETETNGELPDLVSADFDRNGQVDYATLILHGKVKGSEK